MTIKEFILGQKVYAQTTDNSNNQQGPQIDLNQESTVVTPVPSLPVGQVSPTTTATPPSSLGTLLSEKSCKLEYGSLFSKIEDKNGASSCFCTVKGKESECLTLSQDILNSQCTNIKNSERNKKSGQCFCANGYTKNGDGIEQKECLVNNAGTLGIQCTSDQLINNTCHRNIYKTLGIRQSDPTPSPTIFLQDIVLAATSSVGTLIVIALIYLGCKAIIAGAGDSNELSDIQSKLKSLSIGLLLVILCYTIIRVIQYVLRGY